LSDLSRDFKRNLFIPEKKEGTYINPSRSRGSQVYQLKEFTSQKQGSKKPFAFDSKKARNFDPENVERAREGVKELLKDAINKAKEQSKQVREAANNEGYAVGRKEGFQAGENNAREIFAPFLETLQKVIEDLTSLRKRMYVKMEREMVEMIVELTKKIIRFDLADREDSVQDIIRLAVNSVLDRETMVIKVHPEDKTYAESYRPELHRAFGDAKNISFVAHPGVPRGGCVVDSNFGKVEAHLDSLDAQIDKILQIVPPSGEEPSNLEEITTESKEKDAPQVSQKASPPRVIQKPPAEKKAGKEPKIDPGANFWWKQ
jgi:flagellar biosynthesis/type III secretory pathway protein FliH